jgi:hypothetical protein
MLAQRLYAFTATTLRAASIDRQEPSCYIKPRPIANLVWKHRCQRSIDNRLYTDHIPIIYGHFGFISHLKLPSDCNGPLLISRPFAKVQKPSRRTPSHPVQVPPSQSDWNCLARIAVTMITLQNAALKSSIPLYYDASSLPQTSLSQIAPESSDFSLLDRQRYLAFEPSSSVVHFEPA